MLIDYNSFNVYYTKHFDIQNKLQALLSLGRMELSEYNLETHIAKREHDEPIDMCSFTKKALTHFTRTF